MYERIIAESQPSAPATRRIVPNEEQLGWVLQSEIDEMKLSMLEAEALLEEKENTLKRKRQQLEALLKGAPESKAPAVLLRAEEEIKALQQQKSELDEELKQEHKITKCSTEENRQLYRQLQLLQEQLSNLREEHQEELEDLQEEIGIFEILE